MINVKEELKNPKSYIVLLFGLLLGAGLLALAACYRMKKMSAQELNNLGVQTSQLPTGTTTPQVSASYQKALQNPDKPFTDERGVVHPPLGGTGVTTNTAVIPAPPVGGPTPTVPVAPATPKTPSPAPAPTTALPTVTPATPKTTVK